MAEGLKPYCWDNACVKCGQTHPTATTRFVVAQVDVAPDVTRDKEYMERQCQRCGYRWYELPLGQAKG